VPAHPLDNPAWSALTGAHHAYAEVVGPARGYQPDVSVFSAVDELDGEAWAALAELATRHGSVTLTRPDAVVPPAGWTLERSGVGHQMVCEAIGAPPPSEVALVELGVDDAGRMGELVALAQPGPWRARTVELGGYRGVGVDGRLLAMAGWRMRPAGHVEISAVCTHPEAWGRGYGAAVTHAVASAALARGDTPFLHVAASNDRARTLYERLGFRTRCMVTFSSLQLAAGT
jgi:ribosomal protein S18 acetylase RimI-like enzyme